MLGIHKLGLLLIVATSSIVFIEPAPYDVLTLGLAILFFILGLKPPRGISTPFLFLLFMYAGFVISSAFGDYHDLSYKALGVRAYLIFSWLLFASLVYRHPEESMKILWHAYIFAGLITVVWGFMEYFGYIPIADWEGGLRAKGPFKDPNVYGPFLVPVAMFTIYQTMSGNRIWFYLPIATIFMAGILISFSRGAWINTALSLAVISVVVSFSKHSKRQVMNAFMVGILGVIIIFAGLVYIASDELVASRLSERTSITQSYDLKEGGRFDTQKKVLTANLVNPLGFGAGSTEAIYGLVPHNIYLHVMSEGGWIAFAGLLAFIFLSLSRATTALSKAKYYRDNLLIVFACILGLLFQSFFIDSTHWRHLYMMFGLLWGLTLAEQHRNTGKSAP